MHCQQSHICLYGKVREEGFIQQKKFLSLALPSIKDATSQFSFLMNRFISQFCIFYLTEKVEP